MNIGWSKPYTRSNTSASQEFATTTNNPNSTYLKPKPNTLTSDPVPTTGNYSLTNLKVSGLPTDQSARLKAKKMIPKNFNATYLKPDMERRSTVQDPAIRPSSQEYQLQSLQNRAGADDTPADTLKNILRGVKNLPIAQAQELEKQSKDKASKENGKASWTNFSDLRKSG